MQINALKAELHLFDGEINWARPLRLQICFGDGTALRLGVAGDGERLIIDRLPLEPPMDMGEGGRTEIFDVTERLNPGLRGRAIGQPEAIRHRTGKLIGLALPGSDTERFCIWINGDEFRWGPEPALKTEYWPEGKAPAVAGPLFD